MAIKKYQRTAQLFDKNNADLYEGTSLSRTDEWYYAGGQATIIRIPCESSTTYTLKITASDTVFRISTIATDDIPVEGGGSVSATTVVNSGTITEYTFTTSNDAKYILFQGSYAVLTTILNTLMLNLGSTALPYEPYGVVPIDWFYRKYGTETDTLTSLPADVIADGQSATANIIGNMNQQGTPSPQSIIMPDECGNKTANLCNESTIQNGYYSGVSGSNPSTFTADNRYRAFTAFLTAGTYTIKISADETIRLLRCSNDIDGVVDVQTDNAPYTFTLTGDTNIYVSFRNSTTTNSFTNLKIMLNTGSTAKTYEPYGYKIPILSGGTTTPVYLGEVQSTRQIKKVVLTGEETYVSNTKNNDKSIFQVYMNLSPEGSRQPQDVICTHLSTDESAAWTSQRQGITMRSSASGIIFGVAFDVIGTTTSETAAQANTKLKEWLAAQYSAGTPVCVWYVLATPTTGIVNEPIRKISSYSDSVSVTGIPTTGTAESFDIDTELKPSEVDLTYHGWHEHSDTKFTG